MAFYNPLINKEDKSLTGLVPSTLGEPSIPMGYNPNIPDQSDLVPFSVRRQELMYGQRPIESGDSDLIPMATRKQELLGKDQAAQEMWAEFNRPEDEVPLSAKPGFMGKALARSQMAGGQAGTKSFEFGVGLLENALAALAQTGAMSVSGLAGIAHSELIAIKNKIKGGDPAAIDEAGETIRKIQEFVNQYASPKTEMGKDILEKVKIGAESTVGALANWGTKNIVEPTVKSTAEQLGPTAGGIVGGGLTMAPELAMTLAFKGAGRNAIRSAMREVGAVAGEAVDIGIIKPSSWLAEKASLGKFNKELQSIYTPTLTKGSAVRKTRQLLNLGMGEGVSIPNEVKFIEKEIRGVKFPTQAALDDPKAVSTFLKVTERDPEVGLYMLENQRRNAELIREYFQNFKSPGNLNRVRYNIEIERAAVTNEIEKSNERFSLVRNSIEQSPERPGVGIDVPKTGERIRTGFEAEAKAAQKRAQAILNELGDLNDDIITKKTLLRDFEKEMRMESMAEVPSKSIPPEVRMAVRNIEEMESPFISVRQLYKIRKTLRKAKDDLDKSQESNNFARERMGNIIGVVDHHLRDTLVDPGKAADIIQRFRNSYYYDYMAKYEPKTTSGVMKTNVKHGDYISHSMVGGKYFKKGNDGIDSAREFLAAANGNQDIIGAAHEYAVQDMIRNVVDKETGMLSKSKLSNWLFDYKPYLQEMGFIDDFKGIKNISNEIEWGQNLLNEFDKRYLSKMIDADIDSEVKFMMDSPTPRSDMRGLMGFIGKDPEALNGFQSALIDEMDNRVVRDMAKKGVADVNSLYNIYENNKYIYDIAFENSPRKVKALETFLSAMKRNYPEGQLPSNFADLNPIFKQFYRSAQRPEVNVSWLYRNTIGFLTTFGKEKVQRIMRRLALDPEGAITLQRIGRDLTEGKPKLAEVRWRNYLTQIGIPAMTAKGAETGENIRLETQQPTEPQESPVVRNIIDNLYRPGATQ